MAVNDAYNNAPCRQTTPDASGAYVKAVSTRLPEARCSPKPQVSTLITSSPITPCAAVAQPTAALDMFPRTSGYLNRLEMSRECSLGSSRGQVRRWRNPYHVNDRLLLHDDGRYNSTETVCHESLRS